MHFDSLEVYLRHTLNIFSETYTESKTCVEVENRMTIFFTRIFKAFKAAKSVTFDPLFCRYNVSNFQEHSNIAKIRVCILPALKALTNYQYQNNNIYVKNFWRVLDNYQQEKNTCFYKIIHFSM